MIQIMIADDHVIVREGLKKILSLEPEFQVTCEAENGYEALTLLDSHIIDVILMDVRMPKLDGIQASLKIKERYPSIKIIILTTFNEDEYLFEGIKYGISGYLLKDSEIDYVIKSIKEAYRNKMVFDPEVTPKLIHAIKQRQETVPEELVCLTTRELQIARLITQGKSNMEISKILFITEGTVKNSISKILDKLKLQRRTQISALFLKVDQE
jgi:Response regulator containing a CheY-like receiver domain and an HTH DNA-binding domain